MYTVCFPVFVCVSPVLPHLAWTSLGPSIYAAGCLFEFCPCKHTIGPALCAEGYSWLQPQFGSGLLPGSLEVPAGKPQSYQSPGRSEPQCAAQPPQRNSSSFTQVRPTESLKCQLEDFGVCFQQGLLPTRSILCIIVNARSKKLVNSANKKEMDEKKVGPHGWQWKNLGRRDEIWSKERVKLAEGEKRRKKNKGAWDKSFIVSLKWLVSWKPSKFSPVQGHKAHRRLWQSRPKPDRPGSEAQKASSNRRCKNQFAVKK